MRLFPTLSAIVLSMSFMCCNGQSGGTVDVATLKTEIANGGVQLVDVRTPQEWNAGHIQGAKHIDWFSDDFKAQVAKLNKTEPVRLYCASGGRSAEARAMLMDMGFKDVLDLDNGIQAWKRSGGALVK